MAGLLRNIRCASVNTLVCAIVSGCRARPSAGEPTIVFDQVPPLGPSGGGGGVTGELRGHVIGVHPGQRVVLYALSGRNWWIQPLTVHPFTEVKSDGSWSSSTHLGTKYAALLVDPGFSPSNQMPEVPGTTKGIAAVAIQTPTNVTGPSKRLRFSNYDWEVRQIGSDRNGTPHNYDPANASVDANGHLHLLISRKGDGWNCSEVALPRSLGYGTYVFSVADVSQLDPATVLTMFTWDAEGTDQDRREMDFIISHWGNPRGSNGQYIIQPFFRPANTYRYIAPAGLLTYKLRWEPAKVTFSTLRGTGLDSTGALIAEHTFTADVPAPKTESVHLNLCTFDYTPIRQQQPAEVVFQSFQYLP